MAPRSSTFGDDDHNYGGGDVDDKVNDDVGDGDGNNDDNDSLARSAELAAAHCRHLLSASFN